MHWLRGWMVMLAGAAFLIGSIGLYLRDRSLQAAAATWVAAEGRVTGADVGEERRSGDKDFISRVTYSYVVAGRSYSADRVWLTDPMYWSDRNDVIRFLGRYPVGGAVTVYHDPAEPQSAALILTQTGSEQWILVAFLSLGIMLGGFVFDRRRRRAA